ncbi:hypothetical protein GHYDROH2_33190 [Geobacter hydrogenophilus]|uniref:Secreted protein n=1 Tax=Geobacter hydrogenophilus TaxID=40983 RepID=A0A9W6G3V7_9BACT|nr:hypothetical protein GHYDROH2_33190 [Geobacter hydrogenophilus]
MSVRLPIAAAALLLGVPATVAAATVARVGPRCKRERSQEERSGYHLSGVGKRNQPKDRWAGREDS